MKRNAESHLGAHERNRNNAVIGEEVAPLPQWHVREAEHLIGSHHERVDVALALLSNLSAMLSSQRLGCRRTVSFMARSSDCVGSALRSFSKRARNCESGVSRYLLRKSLTP